ncbi:DUF6412 domain-containing protein [Sphaerisporangium sp. NPDC051017]|uniref:DUF6412 domain-containing protein n=1 Tax=Sphaerisporangium sp. NPDC051017 TaxID=3154636 RepID=UPI0034156A83
MTPFHATFALLAQLVAGHSGPAALTAVGLVGVTLLVLAWALGRPAFVPAVAHTAAGRSRAARPVFVRLCHPDTAGRPRPRAPSAGPAPV